MLACEELLRLAELRDRFHDGIDGDGGPVLRASFGDERARLHEVFERDFDVLVVDIELLFQRVQFRLIEDLPPVAANHGILRAGDFPAVRVIES